MHAEFSYAHFVQFIIIVIIKTSIMLSRVLVKKSGTFVQWGYQALHCVHACCFCAGISMSCIEAPYRPIDKGATFFLHLIS